MKYFQVLLYPYEGWAQPASTSYWLLKIPWWSPNRCKIVQVCGTKKTVLKGKMKDLGGGSMVITGKYKGEVQPYFRMALTTAVSNTDFQMGYSITGTLLRGDKKKSKMEMTHFAMIKRKGY